MRQVAARNPFAITTLAVACGLVIISVAPTVAGTPAAPSNPIDPCGLVTAADLQATFGKPFTVTDRADTGGSRACDYDTQVSYFVQIQTSNSNLAEFKARVSTSVERNHGMPDIHVKSVNAPSYLDLISGLLFAWKNNIVVAVSIADYTGKLRDEALEAEREKLANLAISRLP